MNATGQSIGNQARIRDLQDQLSQTPFQTPQEALQGVHDESTGFQSNPVAGAPHAASCGVLGTDTEWCPTAPGEHASGGERAAEPGAAAAAAVPSSLDTKECKWWGNVASHCGEIVKRRSKLKKTVVALESKKMVENADRLNRCATWLLYRHFPQEQATVFVNADFCQQTKLCQNCAYFASLKTAFSYRDRTMSILADKPDLVPLLFTFTIKNGNQLGERLQCLRQGLQKLRQRRRDSGRYRESEWAKLEAAAIRIEIKRGKSGEWHPHAHALVLRDRRNMFNLQEMQKDWREVVGSGNLDVQLTKSGAASINHNTPVTAFPSLLTKDCLECFKYITKFEEASAEDLVEIHRKTFRQHMLMNWGAFNGVKEQLAGGEDFRPGGPFFNIIAERNHHGIYEIKQGQAA